MPRGTPCACGGSQNEPSLRGPLYKEEEGNERERWAYMPSDVVGAGGRACLLSPPSRCCQLQSVSCFLPSLRATICPFLFPFLPVWGLDRPCRWDCGLGESGTVVGRRGPLRAQTSETWAGGVTAGRASSGSGAGKANFLISSAGNGERTRIEWGARNGVARYKTKFKMSLIVQNDRY